MEIRLNGGCFDRAPHERGLTNRRTKNGHDDSKDVHSGKGQPAMTDDDSTLMTFLTVAEIAAQLRCSRALVYQLCERGKLSHTRLGLGRGTIRVSLRDMTEFLESSRVSVEKPETPVTPLNLKHLKFPAAGSPAARPAAGKRVR